MAVKGDMTIYTAEELHQSLGDFLNNYKTFSVSLGSVEDIDTTGLQILLAMKAQAEAADGALVYKDPSESVQDMLQLFDIAGQLELA